MVRGVENKQTQAPRGSRQAITGDAAHFRQKNNFLFRSKRQAFCFQIIWVSFCIYASHLARQADDRERASLPLHCPFFNFFCVGTSPMRTHFEWSNWFVSLTLRCQDAARICFVYDHSIVRYHRSGSVCVYKLCFHSLLYLVDTENRGAGDLEFVVIVATSNNNLAAINW